MKELFLANNIDTEDPNRVLPLSIVIDNMEDVDRRIKILNTLEDEGVNSRDIRFKSNGLVLKVRLKDIPRIVHSILDEGIDIYGVYERY